MRKPHRDPSPLRAELTALKAKVQRVDFRMADIEREFWLDGGVCCPCCGVPGYSEMMSAQERRERRILYIEKKLKGAP